MQSRILLASLLFVSMLARSQAQDTLSAAVSPQPESTVLQLTYINVIFNENVGGVNAGDLRINSNPATSVITNNPNDYTFYFTQPPTGVVQVAWASDHSITNVNGVAFAGGTWTYTLDPNAAPPPRVEISEFMADNANGIQDEDGSRSDWIELLNRGPLDANLSGWFLTDDRLNLTKWKFPPGMTPLAVNGYLRVWASNKNRTNPLAPLHTNFRLAKEAGNFLALVDAKTNIVSAFDPYPLQQSDISYGRDRVDPTLIGYFSTPTPGAPNAIGGSGFAPDPVFSVETGIYTNSSLTVAITANSGTIRYTRDGTVPTTNSTVYTGPLTVGTNGTIKARVFQSGVLPSRVVAKNYLFLDGTTENFNSNLPLIIISTENGRNIPAEIPPGGARTKGSFVLIDTFRGRSSIQGTPDFHGLAEFEVSGQTSLGSDFLKKPIRIELQDELGNDLKVPLLGMPSDSDWRLRNPWDDKTGLNDFLAFELFEKMGHYSLRRQMVEVFIDGTAGGSGFIAATPRLNMTNYYGIMTFVETIKQGNDRVDVPEITPSATNEPAITGGYVFKKDKDSTGDLNFSTSGSTNGTLFPNESLKLHEPKPNSMRVTPGVTTSWPAAGYTASGSNQLTYLLRYLNRMEYALYSSNWLTFTGTNHYSNYLDVDSFVDFHWLVEFTKQIDGYRLSAYFTKNQNGKVQEGPVWDWNLAYGNANYLRGGLTAGWYFQEQDQGMTANEHIWLRRLINGKANMETVPINGLGPGGDPDFIQKCADRWSVLRTNICGLSNTLARIDEMSTLLSEGMARDLFGKYRSRIAGVYQWPNPNGPSGGWDVDYQNPTNYLGTNSSSIIWQMKKWVTGRFTWIDSQFTPIPTFNRQDGPVSSGVTVTINGPAGAPIYYTTDGTDPRGSGGVTNGLLYGGPITITGNSRVVARAKAPNGFYNCWSGPAAVTLYTGIPALRITEIMYHPAPPPAGSTNSAEDFEYIEVKNTGGTPLNVNRFTLSGGIDFQFPNATLAAGESAVIVKDIAAFQSRYGVSPRILGTFTGSLDNAGDHIVLQGGAQEPILDFSYDDDWYPVTDGAGFSLVILDPNAAVDTWGLATSWRVSSALSGSPGQDDPAPPSRPGIVINEALTHTDPPAVDVIELYNPTASPVNIGGWFLSDSLQNPKKFVIPATNIPAGGFVTFSEANFNVGTNGFALGSDGDDVWLFSGDGVNLTGYAHGYSFGPAANGVTFGRYVTSVGEDHFVSQSANTLGANNAGPLVGPIILSEVHYHPLSVTAGTNGWNNTEDEFIELENTSGSPVPLYDPSYPTNTWRVRGGVDFNFPQGVTVPAHGFLLVASIDPNDAAALAAFRTQNAVPDNVPVFGPFHGQLDNSGDTVEVLKPDAPEPPISNNPGFVPYILIERLKYSNTTPWPTNADGAGFSLQRVNEATYANDPINWAAGAPSPGAEYTGAASPAITSQPANATVVAFYGVTNFSVGVNQPAGMRYQWQFNGLNINGAISPTLVLSNVQYSQAGSYRVLVYNQGGYLFSSSATLTVLRPVTIISNPTNLVLRGTNDLANFGKTFSNAVFSVQAVSDNPPMRYQWYYNGGVILGATNSTLTVSNVTLANEGLYHVVITDGISSAPSVPARLSVFVNPLITQQPAGQTLAVGDSTVMQVSVMANPLPLGYRWRRSGNNLTNVVVNETNHSVVLNSLRTNDFGTYTVIVTNAATAGTAGILSSNAYLTVVIPPTNQTADVGSDVTFRALAFVTPPSGGYPIVGYQWSFNGTPIANATSNALTLTSVQATNIGTYSITVSVTGWPNTPPIAPAIYSANLSINGALTLANPQVLSNGTFRALIQGASGNQSLLVEVSTNLTNWATLSTVNYTNGPTPFTDPGATNGRQRFYRARLP
jgi:hypothetical protein